MRKKIQQQSCFKKQSKTPTERGFQAAKKQSETSALHLHCESSNKTCKDAGCSEGYAQTLEKSRNMAGRKFLTPAFPLLLLVRTYRMLISPWMPPCCRFTPSCSDYAEQALKRFGLFRGGYLMCWRLLRCQPFCKGGDDPVPEETKKNSEKKNELIPEKGPLSGKME